MREIMIGSLYEIRPGYSMESGQYDYYDEFSGCEIEILEITNDVEVFGFIRGIGECWIPVQRLIRK